MSGLPNGLSGTWHVFGRGERWVASSNGHNNETIAEVFGHSLEDIKARAAAVSAAPDLLKALVGDDPEMPECITPLSWLRSMVNACNTVKAAEALGGEDQDAWFEMVREVQQLLDLSEAAVKKARGLS